MVTGGGKARFSPATQAQVQECLFHLENGLDVGTRTSINYVPFLELARVPASHSFSLDVKVLCLCLFLCLGRDRFHGEISFVMLAPVLAMLVKTRLKRVRENWITVKE